MPDKWGFVPIKVKPKERDKVMKFARKYGVYGERIGQFLVKLCRVTELMIEREGVRTLSELEEVLLKRRDEHGGSD